MQGCKNNNTGFSLALLVFWREIKSIVDNNEHKYQYKIPYHIFVQNIMKNVKNIIKIARNNVEISQNRQQSYFDKSQHTSIKHSVGPFFIESIDHPNYAVTGLMNPTIRRKVHFNNIFKGRNPEGEPINQDKIADGVEDPCQREHQYSPVDTLKRSRKRPQRYVIDYDKREWSDTLSVITIASMNKLSDEELASHQAVFRDGVSLKYFRSLDVKVQRSYKLVKQALNSRFFANSTRSSLALDHCQKASFKVLGFLRDKFCIYRISPVELTEMLAAREEAKTIDQVIAIYIKKQNAKELYGAKTCNLKIEDLTKVREYEIDALKTRRPRNVKISPLTCFFFNKI
ncbi:hypothetical protein RF11_14266 [Thelohanellus kitauei]|uniref:Uncharacterized protein n=1 Tax=Thelohanellus kitauei TaxID=669202 RepID=A0A0C2MVJ9_THEKT|nr:hypothetical protein RF11_14266 [Thelohanellus kitauei]